MNTVTPVKLTPENFAPFGKCCGLRSEIRLTNSKYEEYISAEEYVYRPMRFGMTMCSNSTLFDIDSMERHLTTEEIIICGDKPIILAVADSDPHGEPQAQDIRVFLLEPGDVVMFNVGIWHDACQAIEGDAFYYFVAHGTGQGDEIVWHNVLPEPLKVSL